MDSTLRIDPSFDFHQESVLSYSSFGEPVTSTDPGSPAHLFTPRPSTAPHFLAPAGGEYGEDLAKRRFPGPGDYELPSPDCVSHFPHRPESPHHSFSSPRSRRAPPVRRRPAPRPLDAGWRPNSAAGPRSPGPASIPRSRLSSGRTSTDPGPRTFRSPRRARPEVFQAENPRWKLGKPHAYFGGEPSRTLTHPRNQGGKFLPGRRSVEPRAWGRPPAAALVW